MTPAPPRTADAAPLIDFFDRWLTEPERRAAGRDLGVALTLAGDAQRQVPGAAAVAGTLALPLLQHAEADDFPARDALGSALRLLGRGAEARDVYRASVAAAPRREPSLRGLASTLTDLRDLPAARDAWRAVLAVNPWNADDHHTLARVLGEQRDWPAAVASCRDSLRLNPASVDVRALLVRILLRSGDPARARDEFDTLVGFAPAAREVWEEWYLTQKAQLERAPGGRLGGP